VKILIMGLPGSGKTTLARVLAERLRCTHFNADDIRENINKDLGFSPEDRIEQARRMGHLCNLSSRWGEAVIADFVCPTEETRAAFGADFVVWMDTISFSRYKDTNSIFVPPKRYDYRIINFNKPTVDHAKEIHAKAFKSRLSVVEMPVEVMTRGLPSSL
jgi:adenylylsulfate kinase